MPHKDADAGKAYRRAYYQANKEACRARMAAYEAANPERRKQYRREYNAANAERLKAERAARYAAEAEGAKAATKAWAARNKARVKASCAARYAANREEHKARHSAYREANRDRVREAQRANYLANRTERIAAAAAYAKANPPDAAGRERRRQRRRAYNAMNAERIKLYRQAWEEQNRDKARAKFARYYASKKQACPAWADKAEILAVYAEAVRLTEETGVLHHVDHIVPLRSKWVCGLHVACNLRAIPQPDNVAKLNRWWPGMFEALAPAHALGLI